MACASGFLIHRRMSTSSPQTPPDTESWRHFQKESPPPLQLSQGLLKESLLPTHQEPQTVASSLGCISLLTRQGCSSPELREGLTVHPELVCVSGVGSNCPSSQRLVFQQNSILLIWSKAEAMHLTPARQSLPVGRATWKVKL